MKIKAISEQHCSLAEVAFSTEPPISQDVFERFSVLARQPSPLGSIAFNWRGGMLTVCGARFSPELKATLEEFLSHAENDLAAEKHAEKQKIQTEKDLKRAKIKAASEAFRVPIQ